MGRKSQFDRNPASAVFYTFLYYLNIIFSVTFKGVVLKINVFLRLEVVCHGPGVSSAILKPENLEEVLYFFL